MAKGFDVDKYSYHECEIHNHGFYLGEQSKQAEIDELYVANVNLMRIKEKLIERNEDMFKQILKRENCNRQLKSEIDELKKRIESAMELLEYNEYVDSALQALEILKGEETK